MERTRRTLLWLVTTFRHIGICRVMGMVAPSSLTRWLPTIGNRSLFMVAAGLPVWISPDGTMVVRADTYGAYIWNGTQWQQLVTNTSMPAFIQPGNGPGLNTSGVYEIQIAPSNSSIMYMEYMGDVFKSTNKGTTWTQTSFAQVSDGSNDAYRIDGQKMAIDPNNPNIVYVGTPDKGLFVTTNGGVTWQQVSAVPASPADSSGVYPGMSGILFDPVIGGTTGGNTNTIFASSYGNGVYESTNAGATWTHLTGGPSNVVIATVSPTGAYYAIGDGGRISGAMQTIHGRN